MGFFCRMSDFMKNENIKNNRASKVKLPEDKFYKVLSSQTIEKGESFVKALIRFLESKYEQVLFFKEK